MENKKSSTLKAAVRKMIDVRLIELGFKMKVAFKPEHDRFEVSEIENGNYTHFISVGSFESAIKGLSLL